MQWHTDIYELNKDKEPQTEKRRIQLNFNVHSNRAHSDHLEKFWFDFRGEGRTTVKISLSFSRWSPTDRRHTVYGRTLEIELRPNNNNATMR